MNERYDALNKAAEKLAVDVPEHQREQFKVDYLEVMTHLNNVIDARIDTCDDEILPLLVAMVPTSPGSVAELRDTYVGILRSITENVMANFGNIEPLAARVLLMKTLQDVLTYCSESMVEGHCRAERRAGKKLF